MSVLRDRLKQMSPELYAALEQSWKIALDDWLGALTPSQGSYNSYPHLRNLQIHLDQVILGIEQSPRRRPAKPLSPAELYVLLAAILFHDIGRAKDKGNHAVLSEEYVGKEYAHLGIPSPLLARTIACIAREHGASQPRGKPLPTVVIDPYGEIRQEPLAALLILVDHMDSAFTRVLPEYLAPATELGAIGSFRRVISGVVVDHEANMVKTAMGALQWAETSPAKYHVVSPDQFFEDCRAIQSCQKEGTRPTQESSSSPSQSLGVDKLVKKAMDAWIKSSDKRLITKAMDAWITSSDTKRKSLEFPLATFHKALTEAANRVFRRNYERGKLCRSLYKMMNESREETKRKHKSFRFTDQDWLVTQRILLAKKSSDELLPPATVLAVVMGDILANGRSLQTVRASLAAIGLPLGAWLMDLGGHLFNSRGQETYEPIFSRRYLKRVAQGMWDLSVGVFGSNLFSYHDLAGLIGETDTNEVRRAVQRISLVACDARSIQKESRQPRRQPSQQATWAGDTEWKWNVHKDSKKRCVFVHVSEVLRLLDDDTLGDPSI